MKKTITITVLLVCLLAVVLFASCSTGGGDGAMIRGKLQHNYGLSIDNRDVPITINGVAITTDKRGFFYYRTDPGQYSVSAVYSDTTKGISLAYNQDIVLGDKELLDLVIYLRDSSTVYGWSLYKQGDYTGAVAQFQNQLNGASGNDALNGLGWASWMLDRNYYVSSDYFKRAVKEVRNVEARIGLCGIELAQVNVEGNAAFGRAYQNMCLALNEPDGFTTLPRHDAVHEGDMFALKAILGYISGVDGEADYILDKQADLLANETNAHGQDLLAVLESFMEG